MQIITTLYQNNAIYKTNSQCMNYKKIAFKANPTIPKYIDQLAKTHSNKITTFVSDFDGTIRNYYTNSIPNDTQTAFKKLIKIGVPVIIATGRVSKELNLIKDFLEIQPEYYILGHGSHVADKEGQLLYSKTLSRSQAQAIINYGKKYKQLHPHTKIYIKGKDFIEEIENSNNIDLNNVYLVMFREPQSTSYQTIMPMYNSLRYNLTNQGLNIFTSSPRCCEIINSNVNKQIALSTLAEQISLKIPNVAFIADGNNDIDLMNFIRNHNGVSISMGNASPELLSCAEYTTDRITDSGFAKAIDNIVKLNSKLTY
ncbi:MAG: Cof-type HAD-IIB family hydrolase [bacterium]|nr:Cof-type HAD-IIB family hydrolase [bacterium]